MNNIHCQHCNVQFADTSTDTSPTSACPSCGQNGNWWASNAASAQVPQQYAQQQYGQMPYPPPKQGMSGGKIALIVCAVVFGFVVLSGVVVGILAVAMVPKISEASKKLEIMQVKDQTAALYLIQTNIVRKKKINRRSLKDVGGQELWGKMIEQKIVTEDIYSKLVSLNTTADDVADDPFSITSENCSYTLPKAGELRKAMSYKGSKRCVLITFNSRNWNNYDGEILVAWSDGREPEFVRFEDFRDQWGITEAEWADPAGKLFGKKAPFQYTHE